MVVSGRGFVPWPVVSRMVHRRQWCLEDCATPGDGALGDLCSGNVVVSGDIGAPEMVESGRQWHSGDSGVKESMILQ